MCACVFLCVFLLIWVYVRIWCVAFVSWSVCMCVCARRITFVCGQLCSRVCVDLRWGVCDEC